MLQISDGVCIVAGLQESLSPGKQRLIGRGACLVSVGEMIDGRRKSTGLEFANARVVFPLGVRIASRDCRDGTAADQSERQGSAPSRNFRRLTHRSSRAAGACCRCSASANAWADAGR